MIRLFLLQQTTKQSDDVPFYGHVQNKGIYTKEYCDTRFPVSPLTGFPSTDTGKLMDINITPAEKEKIMTYLQRLDGRFLPQDLTDKEIFDIVPPRYFTDDAVDAQRWRDYLSNDIFPELNKQEPNGVDNNSIDNNTDNIND